MMVAGGGEEPRCRAPVACASRANVGRSFFARPPSSPSSNISIFTFHHYSADHRWNVLALAASASFFGRLCAASNAEESLRDFGWLPPPTLEIKVHGLSEVWDGAGEQISWTSQYSRAARSGAWITSRIRHGGDTRCVHLLIFFSHMSFQGLMLARACAGESLRGGRFTASPCPRATPRPIAACSPGCAATAIQLA